MRPTKTNITGEKALEEFYAALAEEEANEETYEEMHDNKGDDE